MADQSSPERKPHRRGWIDYARGFVIIYVVYRHAMTGLLSAGVPIRNAIYLVQESSMPVFFIVSGIFIHASTQKRGLGSFVRFKLESLLYPYFVWASIHLTIQIIFSPYLNSKKDLSYFLNLFVRPREIDQFWYLYALFFAMVIFAILNFYILRFKALPNILVALFICVLSYFVNSSLFSLNDILFYYLFLVFGFLISDSLLPVESKFFEGKWMAYLIPIFVVLQVTWWMRYPEVHRLAELDYIGFILFFPITIVSALLIFFISYKLDEWKLLGFLKYIGSHSLYIYIMHLIFTAGIRVVVMHLFPEWPPLVMLVVIMTGGLFIPIACYHLLLKLNFRFAFEFPFSTKKGLSARE